MSSIVMLVYSATKSKFMMYVSIFIVSVGSLRFSSCAIMCPGEVVLM
jgi:hypothetical protein